MSSWFHVLLLSREKYMIFSFTYFASLKVVVTTSNTCAAHMRSMCTMFDTITGFHTPGGGLVSCPHMLLGTSQYWSMLGDIKLALKCVM